jgi:hypothetical protein
MDTTATATFAATAVALYAAHHVGDYWIQTDHQAAHKGEAGADGRLACLGHVLTYLATQAAFLFALVLVAGVQLSAVATVSALAVSGVTHYMADRREFGIMFRLARLIPGKARFLAYGGQHGFGGAWALDQSWHIFWGVFVAALLLAGLS